MTDMNAVSQISCKRQFLCHEFKSEHEQAGTGDNSIKG